MTQRITKMNLEEKIVEREEVLMMRVSKKELIDNELILL